MKLYREVEVKLYKVNVCFDMFILADSSEEAEKVAMDNCQEDLDHCYRDAVQVAMSISDKKDVPREWHHDNNDQGLLDNCYRDAILEAHLS